MVAISFTARPDLASSQWRRGRSETIAIWPDAKQETKPAMSRTEHSAYPQSVKRLAHASVMLLCSAERARRPFPSCFVDCTAFITALSPGFVANTALPRAEELDSAGTLLPKKTKENDMTVDRRTVLATGALALAGVSSQASSAEAPAGAQPMFPVPMTTIP